MTDVSIQRYPAQPSPSWLQQSEYRQLPEILQQVLLRRGIDGEEALRLQLAQLPHFRLLAGIERAVARIAAAIEQQQVICVCGDFDADGATSTALMVSGLRSLGAQQVLFLVPNRFTDGYGLSPQLVQQAQQQGAQLIITVDSGISCHQGVQAAQQLGIDVVITDHHLPGASLPDAYAIVNPNQPGCEFPSKHLAGVGVAFYLLLGLRDWARQQQRVIPNAAQWLDLVALGTVADVVRLDRVNRILVQQGLARIRQGHARAGIQALLQVTGRDAGQLQAEDLGFSLAPRINAAGRLDDMAAGIACLLSEQPLQAMEAALQLDQLNRERRQIEAEMRDTAQQYVAQLQLQDTQLPALLVLYDDAWHQGVVGLVAGRMKEQVQRPVIAFAQDDQGRLKGSARAIPGLHMRDLLERAHSLHPGLIERFGGHAMAAGLSLPAAHLERFTEIIQGLAEQQLDASQFNRIYWSDGELDASCFSLPFVQQLQALGPWGQGFAEPRFDNEFTVLEQRIVGQKYLKWVLEGPDRVPLDAIAFEVDLTRWPDPTVRRIHAYYRLALNHFRGRTSVQLQLEHWRALG